MEEFSQSRGDDDLFDDEITPLPASANIDPLAKQTEKLSLNSKQPSTQQQYPQSSQQQPPSRARGRGRGRVRGPSNRDPNTRPGGGGLNDSKFAPKAPRSEPQQLERPTGTNSAPLPTTTDQDVDSNPLPSSTSTEPQEPSDSSQLPKEPAAQAPAQIPARPPAVRGDRTATGGLKKPKLTEEELGAKIAAAKERSQTLAAKHARAQADAESFAERERIAQVKRKEEVASRRLLEGEREKNRARKLQAMGGRDWDSEKNEVDFRASRYGERIRTGAGPNDGGGQDMSIYEWREPNEYGNDDGGYNGRGRGSGRGRGRGGEYGERRGRGGRGRGGGRGSGMGRGDQYGGDGPLDTSAAEQFPALPSTTKSTKPEPQRQNSDAVPSGSWADQMAA